MPPFRTLPSPTPDPYGYANTQAAMDILNQIEKIGQHRRDRQISAAVANAVAQGGEPEDIKYRVAQVIGNFQPTFDPGIKGWVQQIADRFAPTTQLERALPIYMAEQAFQDPYGVKKAQAEYYKARATPQPKYPAGYKADIEQAISALERGADPYKVYRRIAGTYPDQSTDLKRILLYTPATSRLEALRNVLLGGD